MTQKDTLYLDEDVPLYLSQSALDNIAANKFSLEQTLEMTRTLHDLFSDRLTEADVAPYLEGRAADDIPDLITEVALYLVKHGADINAQYGEEHHTLLHPGIAHPQFIKAAFTVGMDPALQAMSGSLLAHALALNTLNDKHARTNAVIDLLHIGAGRMYTNKNDFNTFYDTDNKCIQHHSPLFSRVLHDKRTSMIDKLVTPLQENLGAESPLKTVFVVPDHLIFLYAYFLNEDPGVIAALAKNMDETCALLESLPHHIQQSYREILPREFTACEAMGAILGPAKEWSALEGAREKGSTR